MGTFLMCISKPVSLPINLQETSLISTGNIVMISQGKRGVDNTYTLREGTVKPMPYPIRCRLTSRQGILRLELDKATYERAGLTGKPIPSPGRKHAKSRFAIDLNLRLPSMVRGRPLFNRMVYAFENALTDSVTWLFYDLRNPGMENDQAGPLMGHAPFVRSVSPDVVYMDGTVAPCLSGEIGQGDIMEATELLEWIRLAMLDSPRLRRDDRIDPYLCRYQIPDLTTTPHDEGERATTMNNGDQTQTPAPQEEAEVIDLVSLRWRGFIPAQFVTRVYSHIIKAYKGQSWAALCVDGFDGDSYTILTRDGTAMTWECE